MRRFNPDKELNKIRNGNKKKFVYSVFLLLIVAIIGYSFALYQVRHTNKLVYTIVKPFSNKDITLAVYLDNVLDDDFPDKEDSYIYDKIVCDNNEDNHVTAYWDYDKWALELETSKKAKCDVYFKSGTDRSGANAPELYQGLVPVTVEDGIIRIADPNTEWYNYSEKKWANAIILNNIEDGIATDFSDNALNAKIVGGAQITEDGLLLDGIDDGIYLDNMIKDIFKHSNTIQVKVKITENGRSAIMGNYDKSNFIDYEIENGTHYVYWNHQANFSGGTIPINEYVLITYVYDRENKQITIYNNDTLVKTQTNALYGAYNTDYTSVYIGRDNVQIGSGSVALQGSIEKVIMYDDILNEDEIRHNINAKAGIVGGEGVVADNLHLYYDFKVKQKTQFEVGDRISMDYINQMYVWIPRYKYQLFNSGLGNTSNERPIKIIFENESETTGDISCIIENSGKENCKNVHNGDWYTHPAFTFGDTELSGIWVGKFESGGTLDDIKILPDMKPIFSQTVPNMFNASRNIETNDKYNLNSEMIDTHMMKNMEWGAVAYLTQSIYGRCDDNEKCNEVSINETSTTGYADSSSKWNTLKGVNASTTGNAYGIYDINGSAWEYVMGVLVDSNGSFVGGNGGFSSIPDKKYYDAYDYSSGAVSNNSGHLGDATRETLSWYNDSNIFPISGLPWFVRGGNYGYVERAGCFNFDNDTINGLSIATFRVVISSESKASG